MPDIIPNVVVSMPSQLFTMPRKFGAVFGGRIYIGLIDTDPTIPSNQIQVYLENEDGSLVPMAQPLLINAGGFPVYNGQIAKFVTVQGHSMAVYDALNVQQFYFPNILKYDPDQFEQRLASSENGNGANLVGFNDSELGPTTVDVALRNLPSKSFLLNGTSSDLGYRYASDSTLRNLHDRVSETLSIMDYVQNGDSGDYSLALQRIFTKYIAADSFHIEFPTGYFSFKTQAVYNGTAVVSISGKHGTTWSLEWNNAQANIAITSVRRIHINDIEIIAKQVVGFTKTAIYLNCTGQDYSHNLSNIVATATIDQPNTGIIMFDLVNFSLGNISSCYVRYFGSGSTTHNIDEFSNNIAWRITATTKVSTDSRFENCSVVGCEIAFVVSPPNGTSGFLEGIAWMRCTVVDCLYGVYISGDNTKTYRSPMYTWIGGHIFAYKACVSCYWVSQIIIQSAIFYLVYSATHSGSFGNSSILLNECVNTQIDNVTIRMVDQIVGPSTSQGIYVGTNCAVVSATNIIVYTASQSRGIVSVPASKYTTAFNVKVYYAGIASTSSAALGGTNDENLGGNLVRAS